jgi:hypothetical protein
MRLRGVNLETGNVMQAVREDHREAAADDREPYHFPHEPGVTQRHWQRHWLRAHLIGDTRTDTR